MTEPIGTAAIYSSCMMGNQRNPAPSSSSASSISTFPFESHFASLSELTMISKEISGWRSSYLDNMSGSQALAMLE